jgi:hypothetical protein
MLVIMMMTIVMVKMAMVIMIMIILTFLIMMEILFWWCEALLSLGGKIGKIQLKLWWDDYDVMIMITMIMMTEENINTVCLLFLFFFFFFGHCDYWGIFFLGKYNKNNYYIGITNKRSRVNDCAILHWFSWNIKS